MYGLPENFDPLCFVQKTLEQISFTANTMHLSFCDDVSITVESCFVYSSGRNTERTCVPVQVSGVMQLIGESVTNAAKDSKGSLVLIFSNGHSFTCLDDTKMYESYRLRFGGEEIVV